VRLWVQVRDKDGSVPIEGAIVLASMTSVTDEDGEGISDVVVVSVTKDGCTPYVDQPYAAPGSDAPIVIGLDRPPVPPEPVLPAVTPLELEVRGHCFQQVATLDHGTRPWTAIQCSDFNLLNRWQHGEDLSGLLAQRRDCGFNLLRVWTAYDIPHIGTFFDLDYNRVPAFVAFCASYGLYVEFCAYTGINDPAHWTRLCDAARQCTPRPLLELVNELSENTNEFDPWGRVFNLRDHARPHDLLVSRGSNGSEKWPVGNDLDQGREQWAYFGMTEPLPAFWTYTTFHTNDAHEWQGKVGHNAMEIWHGPTLSNENPRYCDKATNLAWAEDAAAGAALLCAGSCFHSVAGKTSTLWPPHEEAAARTWASGAAKVRLEYQNGQYTHPIEVETPDLLRVYQRRYPDGSNEQVNIRK
jgi:hypothetical protein